MLRLPTSGVSQPTGNPPDDITHNIELDILCDWIEGSVLFDKGSLSTTDVVSILMRENVYADQDLASHIVARAWSELKRRLSWIGVGSPFSLTRRKMSSVCSWQEKPAHSFCILLSLPQCYGDWSTALQKGDYTEQGLLFESVTKASIENQLLDWQIYQTGWSREHTEKLSDIVDEVASRLGEEKKDIEPWENPDGKDAGLDLLCYRPFPDKRVGIPVYLMQCASGSDWIHKLWQPDLKHGRK